MTSDPSGALTLGLVVSLVVMAGIWILFQRLYRANELWNHIKSDEDMRDPVVMIHEYRAEKRSEEVDQS